jgi:hypothetical protein
MSSTELDNLVRIGKLKREPPTDLAYNAGHALALAALRKRGFRCDQRYIAFQVLPHTLGCESAVWRVLAQAHETRNRSEYEGVSDIDERLLEDVIAAVGVVLERLR